MNFSQFLDLNITRIEKRDRNCTLVVPTTIFNKISSAKIRQICGKTRVQQLVYSPPAPVLYHYYYRLIRIPPEYKDCLVTLKDKIFFLLFFQSKKKN